jgi:pre-peptidase
MRRTIAVLAGSALVVALLPAGTASAAPEDPAAGGQVATKAPEGTKPKGVNPLLALVPDATKVDYSGWRTWTEAQSTAKATRKAQARVAAQPLLVDEDEPDGTQGANDTPPTAQPVDGFGTRARQNNRARILGSLDNEAINAVTLPPTTGEDGAIPFARDTGVQEARNGIVTTGQIGDGAYGSAGTDTGDFDFYEIEVTQPGEVLTIDVTTPTSLLDPMAILYDAEGNQVAFDDDAGEGVDSRLVIPTTETGEYFLAVTGYRVIPSDPFDPASGIPGGGSEGAYTLAISIVRPDVDVYAVNLRKGDILGASVAGSPTYIRVYDPAGREVHGSPYDATYIYPLTSPLPGGGNAVTDHVADDDGWHYIEVSAGSGSYDITVEAYRSVLEGTTAQQTLFLDFDGARVNTGIWGGPGVRQLSPLRAFLGRWGLTTADLNAVIDATVAEFRESVRQDMIDSGLNDQFKVRILNSRDHADPFGQPNVSRVVIGGTIAESGVDTIGIAESIDPGNFETEETALVLLDLLSDPAGPGYSLNTYLTPASNRVAFVGQAVGNVTAHEAGHFLGNFHTENGNEDPNLQDAGGENFDLLFGVGPDGVGGTADDIDVDFGEDVFESTEGFTGIEDTLGRIATVLE